MLSLFFVPSVTLNDLAVIVFVTPTVSPKVAFPVTTSNVFPCILPEAVTLPLASTEKLLELVFKVPAIVVFPVVPSTINLLVFNVKPSPAVNPPRKVALPLVSIFNFVSAKLPPLVGVSKFSLLKLLDIGLASFQEAPPLTSISLTSIPAYQRWFVLL